MMMASYFGRDSKAPQARGQILVIHVQAFGDRPQVLGLENLAIEQQAVRGLVVDDDPAVPVEDLSAGGQNRQRLHAVAQRGVAVELGVLDLQLPEARDQENDDRYGDILEERNLARRELRARSKPVVSFTESPLLGRGAIG